MPVVPPGAPPGFVHVIRQACEYHPRNVPRTEPARRPRAAGGGLEERPGSDSEAAEGETGAPRTLTGADARAGARRRGYLSPVRLEGGVRG
ncbi:unnamed protein product [Rangifer tarandus platyrhynchus]